MTWTKDLSWDEKKYEEAEEDWHATINNFNTEVSVNRCAGSCEDLMEKMVGEWEFDNKDSIKEWGKYVDDEYTRKILLGAVYRQIRLWMQFNDVEVELYEYND